MSAASVRCPTCCIREAAAWSAHCRSRSLACMHCSAAAVTTALTPAETALPQDGSETGEVSSLGLNTSVATLSNCSDSCSYPCPLARPSPVPHLPPPLSLPFNCSGMRLGAFRGWILGSAIISAFKTMLLTHCLKGTPCRSGLRTRTFNSGCAVYDCRYAVSLSALHACVQHRVCRA